MDIVSEICIYFLWLWRKINPLLPVTRSFIKNFFWVCWENRRKSSKESDRKIAAYFLAVDQRGFGRSELDASSSNVVGGVEFRETQTKVIQSEREKKSRFPEKETTFFSRGRGKNMAVLITNKQAVLCTSSWRIMWIFSFLCLLQFGSRNPLRPIFVWVGLNWRCT